MPTRAQMYPDIRALDLSQCRAISLKNSQALAIAQSRVTIDFPKPENQITIARSICVANGRKMVSSVQMNKETVMNAPAPPKVTRLHIRASASQKALLAQAAQARHLNVSQFVLQTCLEAAEKAVQEQKERERDAEISSVIRVSAESFDWLMKKLDEPPQDNPALRHLLAEPPRWKSDESPNDQHPATRHHE